MIKMQRQNAPVLLLDAGDALYSDRPLTEKSKGALIIEAMNMMAYDAMALGEQDLLLGADVLRQRIDEADFPIISANVWTENHEELFTEPYVIVEKNHLKIGILGLTGTPAETPAGFNVSDPIEAAQKYVFEIDKEADVVVVLSHLGWTKSDLVARLSFPIDFVIGGGVEQSTIQYYEAPNGTRLAQAEFPTSGHAGRYVGMWVINANKEEGVIASEWQDVSLGPEFNDDQGMLLLLGY